MDCLRAIWDGSVIYMNNAASAWPKAPGVSDAVRGALDRPPIETGRASMDGEDMVADCRRMLARLLRVTDTDRIVITQHATAALNLALRGLRLPRRARIVSSVVEHNSVLRPLEHLCRERKYRVVHVGLDRSGSLDMEKFRAALAKRPALVVLNHISNVNGLILDIASLFAEAKAGGALTLLDASQSLGLLPVHPGELNADMVAFTGHKATLGPEGVGGLYVSEGVELEQVLVGGTGIRSEMTIHPPEMPLRLEAGTYNIPALAGWLAALSWLERHGHEHVERASRLGTRLKQGLAAIHGVRLFVPEAPAWPGIVSLQIAKWPVAEVGYILARSFHVIARTGLHCAPLMHHALGSAPAGTVRLSLSGFNQETDVERAIAAITQLAA